MRRELCTAVASLLVADGALAAGGAHVIDDAAVIDPGTCHVESWASRSAGDAGLVTTNPGCVLESLPNLELGVSMLHNWQDGDSATTVGVSPKLVLRGEDTGLGIGLSGALGFGVDRGRIESAAMVMPVTVPAGTTLRLNFNLGWLWTRTDDTHAAFAGAQAEVALGKRLGAMVEGFTRDTGKAGMQAGLRWTPRDAVDIDLIAGRYLDGVTPTTLTLGITIRR